MYFYTFYLLLLSYILQALDAAPGNLPFEVDMDSGNTGIDTGLENGLTAQASKQGENFVDSPKPADITEGFSFDSEAEVSPKTKNKPTKTTSVTTNSTPNPSSTTDTTSVNAPTAITGAKEKRKPINELSGTSPSSSMIDDPFFAFALKQFMQQQQLLMSLLSSDLMGMDMPGSDLGLMNPMFPFNGSPFQMPNIADMQQSFDISNMELVEDRVIDDKKGKGHVQTYKSKDGAALIQTVTYNQSSDGSVIPTLPGEQTITEPTMKSSRPRSSRGASSRKTHSTRRIKVH